MAVQHTDKELCLIKLVQCFYESSKGDGDKETLTLEEFKKMVKNDFPNFMKDCNAEQVVKSIDTNSDNKVKYSEYWNLLGQMAKDIKIKEKKKH